MKALFFFLLSLFYLQQCYAQKAVVANLKENVAYVGLNNPIAVMVEGYTCDQIEVSTNNGIIIKSDGSCNYIFIPQLTSRATIYIQSKSYTDSIEFRTKLTPDPDLEVESNRDNLFHIKRPHLGLIFTLRNFNYDVRYRGQRYSVSIKRGNNIVFERKNIKGILFEEIKEGLKKLEVGDKILFNEIIFRGPDNLDRKLSPVEFTVVE